MKFLIFAIAVFRAFLLFGDTIITGSTEGDITLEKDSETGILVSGEIRPVTAEYKFIKAILNDDSFADWTPVKNEKYQSFSYTDGKSFPAGNLAYEINSAHGLIREIETVFIIWRGTENHLPDYITGIGSDLETYAEVKDKTQLERYLNKAEALYNLLGDRIKWDRNKIISLQSRLAGLDGEIATLQKTIDSHHADIENREDQIADRNNLIDVKEQEIHTLEVEKAALDPIADAVRIAEINAEITELTDEVQNLVEANEADNIAIFETEQVIAETEEQKQEYENLKFSIPEEITYLTNEKEYLENNQENLDELIDEYNNLNISSSGSGSGNNSTVQYTEKDSSDISGLAAAIIAVPLSGLAAGIIYEESKEYFTEKEDSDAPEPGVKYDYPELTE